MLRRHLSDDGVVTYRSPRLERVGVPHAFATRIGGVSSGPFASLNLGNPSGDVQDDGDHIAENYRRLHRSIGCEDRARCFVHQVHGCDVAHVTSGFTNNEPSDAIVCDDPTILLAIRTADCVPILLATRDGRRVSAVHAGWRGIVAHIILRAVEAMGTSDLIAAIGPCIGFDAFEVGDEVLRAFEDHFNDLANAALTPSPSTLGEGGGEGLSSRSSDDATTRGTLSPALSGEGTRKGHVDLREAVLRQLVSAGVSIDDIDITDRCTFRDADEFFSHRRERGLTGRMAAVIGAIAP